MLLQIIGFLLLAMGALAAAVVLVYRHTLPRVNGQLKAAGLVEPVTVRRDPHGYVRIEATSVRDAVFAQGFVHAQDRLWQMELNRRVGSGRLAEIFGQLAVPADTFTRRLGLRRAALTDLENLAPVESELLEAYAAGVNAGRKAMGWRLPIEFRLLGFTPEAWTVQDSLTWIQVMSMDLCSNWEQELLRGKILAKLGSAGASLLHLFTRDGAVTVPQLSGASKLYDRLSELYEEAKVYLPNAGVPGASNAWVVDGKRSASGKPLLASDPHLMGRVPSVWYEVHLVAPNLDVQGVSFPGLPLIVIGHNQKVAWGVTNSFADTQDLYMERFHPDDPSLVETEAGFMPLQVFTETILVKDGPPVVEEVQVTRHGPILIRSELGALSLKWINYEPSHPVATLLAMNQAASAPAFKEALRHWQAPSNNFVYADVEGNIGYLMAGHIPVRKKGTGLTPVPGWDGEWEWISRIPFEELPGVDNPPCGYVVTANNPVVDSSFPYHITWDWQGSSRATRIESMIVSQETHTADDFQKMQMDFHSGLGLRFVKALERLSPPPKSGEARVLGLLRDWDGDGGAASAGMAIYQVMVLTTLKEMLEPTLGPELFGEFLGTPANPLAVMAGHTGRYTTWLVNLMEQPETFAALGTTRTLDEVLQAGLSEATRFLENRLGPDPGRWSWGRLHRLVFQHALGVNRVLGGLFNSPSVPMGGDTDTVFQTAVIPHQAFAQAWCPSWRQVIDLSCPQAGRSVIATGQSGHPASRNYMDQFKLWNSGELRPHPTEYKDTLKLSP
jgi:penicillin amidase